MEKTELKTYPILFGKRFFDVMFSLMIIIIFSPILLFIIACIFLEHVLRGRMLDPIFYKEIRMSHSKPFYLIKFNIFNQVVIDAMRSKKQFIHTKDLEKGGKLTFIGFLLKQIYLDELPQIWNVLKGNMSLVGPRPLNKEVYDNLDEEDKKVKSALRAGITGNFQSQKNMYGKKSHTLDKEYLIFYRTHSTYKVILFDIKIILRTMRVILQAKGI